MKLPGRRLKLESGVTYVEILISALLMAIGLMGLLNTWAFSFNITQNTDDTAIAYSLGRYALERVKMAGFKSAAEGATNAYYSGNEVSTTAGSSICHFSVTTSITSGAVSSGTIGVAGAVPNDGTLRTVVITTKLYSTSAVLYQTTTYLSRAGI